MKVSHVTAPLLFVVAGCGSTPPATQPEGAAPDPHGGAPVSAGASSLPSGGAAGEAHAVLMQASGCWFGALWAEAEGAAPEERRRDSEKRCFSLVKRLYGSEDKAKYDQLRLVNAEVVDRIAAEIDTLAGRDASGDGPRKASLAKLLRAVASAQRENNDAHTAADIVKGDLKGRPPEPDTLSKDEVAAVAPLRAHAALEALLKLDAGDLTPEAHAMGLLAAMDRMEVARGLPKHLKVFAVADAYQLVFGVTPPPLPADPTAKLVPGTWLTYLTDTARAAGHAVPDKATTPREREPWAWGGVIEGFADKLRGDAGKGMGFLAKVSAGVVKKLDAEWAEIPEIAARQGGMGEREAKDKKK